MLVKGWVFTSLCSVLLTQTGMAASRTASHTDIVRNLPDPNCSFYPEPMSGHASVPLTPQKPPLFLREGVWDVIAWESVKDNAPSCSFDTTIDDVVYTHCAC